MLLLSAGAAAAVLAGRRAARVEPSDVLRSL
jgi:hypothetical protein